MNPLLPLTIFSLGTIAMATDSALLFTNSDF